MKVFCFTIAAAAAAALLVFCVMIPQAGAQTENSQLYHSQRFVLVAAPVNVFSPQMNGGNAMQNVIVRMDTVTGRSWILQLDVAGGNAPRVRHSSWHDLGFKAQ